MVDASTSLQLILAELTKIKTKMEQMAPTRTNVALDDQTKRREELRKQTDDRRYGLSDVMRKLLDATLGKTVSSNLTSTERLRFESIAKTFNKVLKVDLISKSINQLKEANQEAAEQQQRRSLFDRITEKIKPSVDTTDAKSKEKVGGSGWMKLGLIGAGLGILGSIFTGKVNLGPFQGTIGMMTKWLTTGGIKSLFFGMEIFFKTLVAPLKLIKSLFSKESASVVTKIGEKVGPKFLSELMPKLMKVGGLGLKALSKIPFGIGSLISFYFAYNRYKRGDYTGALIDVASGVASFTGVGLPFAIGLDVINAIRDASSEKSSDLPDGQKGWFSKSMDAVMEWISANYYDLPVIGPAVRAYEHFQAGEYKQAFTSLLHIMPGAGVLLDLVDISETSSRQGVEVPKFGLAGKFLDYVNENCYEWPVFGPMIRAVEHLKDGNFLESLISMSHVVPWFGAIADLMNIKESDTRGELKTFTPRTLDGMIEYITDVVLNLPVVGNMLKALNHFADGDYESGFNLILPKGVMSAYKKIQSKIFTPPPVTPESKTTTPNDKKIEKKIESDTFKQPQPPSETIKLDLTGLTDLQTTIAEISQQELQLMSDQRQILMDNRSLLQIIAQNVQNMSPSQIINDGNKINFREEISSTRSTYLESVGRMATSLR